MQGGALRFFVVGIVEKDAGLKTSRPALQVAHRHLQRCFCVATDWDDKSNLFVRRLLAQGLTLPSRPRGSYRLSLSSARACKPDPSPPHLLRARAPGSGSHQNPVHDARRTCKAPASTLARGISETPPTNSKFRGGCASLHFQSSFQE